MANNESEVERRAGIDMVPLGESFEWNPGPDDGAPILRHDFDLKVSEQGTIPWARNSRPDEKLLQTAITLKIPGSHGQ